MSNRRRIMWNATVRGLPLSEQLKATALAGCEALAVTPSDYNRWLGEGMSTADMKEMARDQGVRIDHLDPIVRWVDDWQPRLAGFDFPVALVGYDMDDFFRMAGALEVHSFTAWGGFADGRYSRTELIDAFGALCERARGEGLRCDLEFMPVFQIKDLRTAWDLVSAVDAPNSGIVLDMWHYFRGVPDDALLRSIPGERITAVQLCDAPARLPEGMSLAEEGLGHRLAPGEGDFPIGPTLDILRATNGLNNVGVEVFSATFDAMSAEQVGMKTKALLDKALARESPLAGCAGLQLRQIT